MCRIAAGADARRAVAIGQAAGSERHCPARVPLLARDSSAISANLSPKGSRFSTIYADPPWKYDNQGTRAATDNHYPTLTVEQIAAEPVAELAADNCHLHLWTTNGFLPAAFYVIEAWGFEYKSMFVWVKPTLGIGNYYRLDTSSFC